MSWVKMSGVKVLVGSKCCFRALGQNFGRVKVSEGQTVGRVKLSLGSKCRQGQSVFGVNVGVSRGGTFFYFLMN